MMEDMNNGQTDSQQTYGQPGAPQTYGQNPYAQQPYGQNPYPPYPQQQMPPSPPTHLVWSIISLALCCLPLGIVALINSTNVSSKYSRGDYQGALEASRSAKRWNIACLILGLIANSLYLVFTFAGTLLQEMGK